MQEHQKYLDLQSLSKLKGLELKARMIVEGYVSGLHKSPYHGFSVEFAEHREYVPGDDLRYVDWKVFGKRDRFYLKQYEQKYYISFEVPKGGYGLPNVFEGGRKAAEVRIRTIAKKEYRDSFWMLPTLDDNGNVKQLNGLGEADSYLDLESSENDVLGNWLSFYGKNVLGISTDATLIEESVAELNSQNIVYSNSGETVSIDNFFFSPLEHHMFTMKASVTNEYSLQDGYRPYSPEVVTNPPYHNDYLDEIPDEVYENPYIEIRVLKATNADHCDVFLYEGELDSEEIMTKAMVDKDGLWVHDYLWIRKFKNVDADFVATKNAKSSLVFADLKKGTVYTIVATAKNKYGVSIPEIKTVATAIKVEDIAKAGMSGKVKLGDGTNDAAHIYKDGSGILITDMNAINAVNYKVFWKNTDLPGDDVDSEPWKFGETGKGGTAYKIEKNKLEQKKWVDLVIRIYGYNEDGGRGADDTCWESFVSPPSEFIELEDAKNVSNVATGSFHVSDFNLINSSGELLKNGIHFNYGDSISNMFDSNNSGEFDQGKLMRIVINGQNVISKMLLEPIAWNLASSATPQNGQFFIDPVRGKFVLPRPVYWSKCTSGEEFVHPELGFVHKPSFYSQGNVSYPEGRLFLHTTGKGMWDSLGRINPFIENIPDTKEGFCSFENYIRGDYQSGNKKNTGADAYTRYYLTPEIFLERYVSANTFSMSLKVNGKSLPIPLTDNLLHVFGIAWNFNVGGAFNSEGNNVIVYKDGVVLAQFIVTNPPQEKIQPYFELRTRIIVGGGNGGYWAPQGHASIDNIKIWLGDIRNPQGFATMAQSGIEDALHPIYGEAYNYKPVINNSTSPDSGVGYYQPYIKN